MSVWTMLLFSLTTCVVSLEKQKFSHNQRPPLFRYYNTKPPALVEVRPRYPSYSPAVRTSHRSLYGYPVPPSEPNAHEAPPSVERKQQQFPAFEASRPHFQPKSDNSGAFPAPINYVASNPATFSGPGRQPQFVPPPPLPQNPGQFRQFPVNRHQNFPPQNAPNFGRPFFPQQQGGQVPPNYRPNFPGPPPQNFGQNRNVFPQKFPQPQPAHPPPRFPDQPLRRYPQERPIPSRFEPNFQPSGQFRPQFPPVNFAGNPPNLPPSPRRFPQPGPRFPYPESRGDLPYFPPQQPSSNSKSPNLPQSSTNVESAESSEEFSEPPNFPKPANSKRPEIALGYRPQANRLGVNKNGNIKPNLHENPKSTPGGLQVRQGYPYHPEFGYPYYSNGESYFFRIPTKKLEQYLPPAPLNVD